MGESAGWFSAAKTGDLSAMQRISTEENFNINLVNEEGCPALMLASLEGHIHVVNWLLNTFSEIDVNVTSKDGATALLLAVMKENNFEVVKALCDRPEISKTVNNQHQNDNSTAIINACMNNDKESVKIILQVSGVDVNCQTAAGDTALMFASANGSKEIVEMLLNTGLEIDVNIISKDGATALWAATKKENNSEVVKALCDRPEISKTINNKHQDDNSTALINACITNDKESVKIILQVSGVDVNCQNAAGDTALLLLAASQEDNSELVKALCDRPEISQTINNQDKDSNSTALIFACIGKDEESAKAILQVSGVDVNCQTSTGDTALIWASLNDLKEIVENLLRFPNIDINVISNNGYTAFSIGKGKEIKDMLLDKMFGGKVGNLVKLGHKKNIFGKESWCRRLFILEGNVLSYQYPRDLQHSKNITPSMIQSLKVEEKLNTIELNEHCLCSIAHQNSPAYGNRFHSHKSNDPEYNGIVGKPSCIELRMKSKDGKHWNRTFYIQAESFHEAEKWVQDINTKINAIKNRK